MNYQVLYDSLPWLEPSMKYLVPVLCILSIGFTVLWLEGRNLHKQKTSLQAWTFSDAYIEAVMLKYPHLQKADVIEAFEQLRLYFHLCLKQEKKLLAMPSVLVDKCWHEFLLDSRNYIQFCDAAFGRYLHHVPSKHDALLAKEKARDPSSLVALARTYQGAIKADESKRARETKSTLATYMKIGAVPALFSIDERLRIVGGCSYSDKFLIGLAAIDLKKFESETSNTNGAADGSGVACGDGGACGCGGTV